MKRSPESAWLRQFPLWVPLARAPEGAMPLRADVTRSDAAQLAFVRQRQVMGPPTLMLFDPAGGERRAERLVGEFGPDTLLQRLPRGGRS